MKTASRGDVRLIVGDAKVEVAVCLDRRARSALLSRYGRLNLVRDLLIFLSPCKIGKTLHSLTFFRSIDKGGHARLIPTRLDDSDSCARAV